MARTLDGSAFKYAARQLATSMCTLVAYGIIFTSNIGKQNGDPTHFDRLHFACRYFFF
jgi:hypothetical protein